MVEPLQPLQPVPVLNKVVPKELTRYIEIEKEIQELEAVNALKNYELKKQAANNAEEACTQVADHLEQLRIHTAEKKQKAQYMNLGNIQSMFEDESSFEKPKTIEEEEYMEALNEEECARSKLENLKSQLKQLRADANKIKGSAKTLKELHEERDTLLCKEDSHKSLEEFKFHQIHSRTAKLAAFEPDIFQGEYGSEKESRLEQSLDSLNDQKQRFIDANYKWNSAKGHLQQGVNQLTHAVHRWKALFHVPVQNPPMRFMYATDTRNNLLAAQQNISSTYKYLPNINFPYCAPPEMTTLDIATNNIYSDMQTPERHAHALKCYDVTMRRAAALLQWFDTVIKSTIQEDLKKTTQAVRETEQKLRQERVRLMKEKILESGGDVKGLGVTAGLKELAEEPKVSDAEIVAVEGVGVIEAEKMDEKTAETLGAEDEGEPEAPPPVPLSQLAPLPSADELFGNISQLKEEHQKETAEVLKMQEVNKARMQQGLQAKLQARRQKKHVE